MQASKRQICPFQVLPQVVQVLMTLLLMWKTLLVGSAITRFSSHLFQRSAENLSPNSQEEEMGEKKQAV